MNKIINFKPVSAPSKSSSTGGVLLFNPSIFRKKHRGKFFSGKLIKIFAQIVLTAFFGLIIFLLSLYR